MHTGNNFMFSEDLNFYESDDSANSLRNASLTTHIDATFDNLKLDLSYINSSSDVTSEDGTIYDSDLESGNIQQDINTRRYYTKILDVAVRRGYE